MSKNTYTKRSGRTSLLALVTAVMLGFFTNALAQNSVTIADFTIKPGEEKTLAVCLDNADPMSALQMDIQLPAGITYKEGSLKRNEERLDRTTHSIYMSNIGNQTYRLLILPSSQTNMRGNSGAVAYFTVTADDNFTELSHIYVNKIIGSSSTVTGEGGETPSYAMSDISVAVSPNIGKLYVAEDSLAIKTDGSYKKISIALDNKIAVRGMQADITLPEGLTVETNDNGETVFEYGDRLGQNMIINSNKLENGKLRVMVYGLTDEIIATGDGTVFAFNVKADETLPLLSEVVMDNVLVSDEDGAAYPIDEVGGIEVTNSFLAHYTPANDSVQALRDMLAETVAEIAEVAPDVKDNEEITAAQADIEAKTDNLQKSVDEAYADETLAENFDEVMAPSEEIIAAIEKLLEDAIKAQEEHDTPSGIDAVTTDGGNGGEPKIFNTNGQQLAQPSEGEINIFAYPDGTVKKVLVK